MNLTIAPTIGKRLTPGLRRICGLLTTISCIVLLTGVPARADQMRINSVVQNLSSLQGTTNLQLSLVSQDPVNKGNKGGTVSPDGPRNDTASVTNDPKLDALLSGLPVVADTKIGVDDVSVEGEVEGTICDCGEILIAEGGFPMWPLAFLAAVPVAFIDFGDEEECTTCDQRTPTPSPTPIPTPTPPPTPTPEPASLLIFGTGLIAAGAGLRRRYARTKLANEIQKTEEE
jgi:PEP-CTERM motif